MSEVTKRLMTDTTGQDIVQAIENLSIAVKPNATDIHMSSSDSTSVAQKINSEIATVADGIAIVAEGDVHAAITEGQFVYVRNHSTLAQGVYKATAAIGTNAALSTSNLTLDNAGGLNDLQAQITSLNSNFIVKTYNSSASSPQTETLEQSSMYILASHETQAGYRCLVVFVTATATMYRYDIVKEANITITTNGLDVTVTPSAGSSRLSLLKLNT